MWKSYREINQKYKRISLTKERRLIALAQKGYKRSIEEIVLRHVGFINFRIHKKVYPEFLHKFREDILSEGVLLLYEKIKTYDLNYRDKSGNRKRVRFVSYIWKRVDGMIIDFMKKEGKYKHLDENYGIKDRM